jgi:eukaryotic-like serine/threonine-protein kinase
MPTYSTFRQVVERVGPLDCKRAARYVQEVAQQLSDRESAGLPLSDVRPSTIFLDTTGTARLATLELDAAANNENMPEGEVAEIADCVAPERAINSHKADRRADIYSLGCVFYYLLIGRAPFDGSISERLYKHQTADPNAISDVRQDVPQSLVHICNRMMQKNPKDRFATADEVVEAIETWRSKSDPQGN